MEGELITREQIKEVDFRGSTLLAVQKHDKVYVAIRWVCEGLGLTIDQMKRQRKNLHEDVVLSKGVSVLTLPTNGGLQEVLCIDLEFLPLWLAKINITPTMKRDNPEAVERLVEYQLKAKEVLASAFIRPKTSAELLLAQAELLVQTERRLHQIEEGQRQQQAVLSQQQQQLSQMIGLMSETPIRSRIVRKVKEFARHRNTTVKEAWHEIYWVIGDKYGIDLARRIQNKRNKINLERIESGLRSYSEATLKQKVNALDIIMEENMAQDVIEIIAGRMYGGQQ